MRRLFRLFIMATTVGGTRVAAKMRTCKPKRALGGHLYQALGPNLRNCPEGFVEWTVFSQNRTETRKFKTDFFFYDS